MRRWMPLLLVLAVASSAWAHSLRCFPTVAADGTVTLRCYFRIGQPAVDAAVTVTGPDGVVVFTGRSDAAGIARFVWPGPGPLTVVVADQAGHRVEMELPAERFVITTDAAPAPPQPESDETGAMRARIQELEAEVASLRAEASEREWLRVGIALTILLGIAAVGVALSRRRHD